MRLSLGTLFLLVLATALYTLIAVPILGVHNLNWISIIVYGAIFATFVRAATHSRQ